MTDERGMMTPFELDILLHYYCRVDEHQVVYDNPLIWPSTREMFLREGLLTTNVHESYTGSYKTTERAEVYIKHILSLPLPVQKWEMP